MDPKRIEWLQDWDRNIGPARQRAYVESELAKLKERGEPILYAIVTRPFPEQQDLALSCLRDQGVSSVMLRLVEGARPPPHDAQGRTLDESIRGKVFRTKVRTFGAASNGAIPDEIASKRFSGPLRNDLAKTTQGLYVHVDIGRRPVPIGLDDAVVIMRQHGHGVSSEQWRRRKKVGGTDPVSGKVIPDTRVDLWLVEEVTDRMLEEEQTRPAAKPAPTSKPAAA